MNRPSMTLATGAQRGIKLLLGASALGELAVGIAVAIFPRTVSDVLLGAPAEGVGAVVARMAGVAIAALGLTWWLARNDLDERLTSIAPGFLGYNFGVGVLFLLYALASTASVPVTWLVAGVHLLAGLGFCALFVQQRSRQVA
jgi:hypothetical protein